MFYVQIWCHTYLPLVPKAITQLCTRPAWCLKTTQRKQNLPPQTCPFGTLFSWTEGLDLFKFRVSFNTPSTCLSFSSSFETPLVANVGISVIVPQVPEALFIFSLFQSSVNSAVFSPGTDSLLSRPLRETETVHHDPEFCCCILLFSHFISSCF